MEAASRAATTVSDRVYELEVLVRELEAYIEAATLTPVAAADPQTLEIDRQAVTSAAATLAYMRCRLLLSNGESSVLDLRYEHFAQPSHGRPKHEISEHLYAKLITQLDQRLLNLFQTYRQHLKARDDGSAHTSPQHLMAQARQLPGLMRLKDEEAMTLRHQVEDAQTTRTQLTQQLHEASLARCVMLKASSSQRERRTCTQLLAENEASIANILSQHKLKEAKQYLDAFERHLSASLTLVTTQLRTSLTQLMVDIYTPTVIEQLVHVKNQLDHWRDHLARTRTHLQLQLESYQALGPEFFEVATEYARIKKELRNRRWAAGLVGEAGAAQENHA